jgi:AraC family transcriptional regulator, arabinose operon regulatory protein
MVKEIRYYRLSGATGVNQSNSLANCDLYLTEAGELEVEEGTIWNGISSENYLLAFCIRGEGIVLLAGEQVPVSGEQFFIIPPGESFKYYSVLKSKSRFLVAGFNGKLIRQMSREFSVVRNLVPSVNNMVANREMLFEELFNNLSKGFHPRVIEYVNLCFGHLLATFTYATRNSDDLADELNPAVHRAIHYLEKNLHKKLTLQQIAKEAGFSPTYFTTVFRKHTNYSPLSYFSHLKILKACEMLDYTRLKVKEVSYRLGYTDPYYFTREFKNKMGMSPRQYRNRVRSH